MPKVEDKLSWQCFFVFYLLNASCRSRQKFYKMLVEVREGTTSQKTF
jgi:hypothetical protein